MAKYCMNCGNQIDDNAAFCIHCGKPVIPTRPRQPVCPYCGRILDPQDRFCKGCGRALQNTAPQPQQLPRQLQPQPRPIQPQASQQSAQYRQAPQQAPRQPQPQTQPARKKKTALVWLILAAVISVAAFSILAFWKPGFGRNWFSKKAKLENGIVELDEFFFDFTESELENGTVTVYKDRSTDVLADEGLVSDIYEMTIDGECSDPVTVKMKVPKEYTGEDGQALMLAVGTDYDESTDTEMGRHYYFVEAEVDGDTATAVFVPEDIFKPALLYRKSTDASLLSGNSQSAEKKYTGSRVVRFAETLRNWVHGENPRFLISYPYFYNVSESDTNAFIKDLEDMWDWYAAKGYSFEGLQPLSVYIIKGSDSDPDAAFSRSKLGEPMIEFRRKFIFGEGKTPDYSGTSDLARPLMYHEFYHAIQDQYIGQNRHTLWFDEATATYYEHCAETRFGIANSYKYAKTTEENYRLALESMIPSSKTIAGLESSAEGATYWEQVWHNKKNIIYGKIGDEGYARGPFCDIVSEIKGNDDWIRSIYEEWKTGGVSNFKSIENIADSIPNLAFKLYQRFLDGTYTETGFISLNNRASYYYDKNSISVPKKDLEALKEGRKKSLTVTGKTYKINGQGAVVVGLNLTDLDSFKSNDTKYNISVSVKGKDLEYETYELWKYDALPVSGNYIKNVYKAMSTDKNKYSTLVVSKKPFETVDEFTMMYEFTAYTEEPETEEETEEGGLTPSDVAGTYKMNGSGIRTEKVDLGDVTVDNDEIVDLSAVMTVKPALGDKISIEITGDVNFRGEFRLKPDGKVETGRDDISLGFHEINGISATLFWKTDDLDGGLAGTK